MGAFYFVDVSILDGAFFPPGTFFFPDGGPFSSRFWSLYRDCCTEVEAGGEFLAFLR